MVRQAFFNAVMKGVADRGASLLEPRTACLPSIV
jgi:hypothetical protein